MTSFFRPSSLFSCVRQCQSAPQPSPSAVRHLSSLPARGFISTPPGSPSSPFPRFPPVSSILSCTSSHGAFASFAASSESSSPSIPAVSGEHVHHCSRLARPRRHSFPSRSQQLCEGIARPPSTTPTRPCIAAHPPASQQRPSTSLPRASQSGDPSTMRVSMHCTALHCTRLRCPAPASSPAPRRSRRSWHKQSRPVPMQGAPEKNADRRHPGSPFRGLSNKTPVRKRSVTLARLSQLPDVRNSTNTGPSCRKNRRTRRAPGPYRQSRCTTRPTTRIPALASKCACIYERPRKKPGRFHGGRRWFVNGGPTAVPLVPQPEPLWRAIRARRWAPGHVLDRRDRSRNVRDTSTRGMEGARLPAPRRPTTHGRPSPPGRARHAETVAGTPLCRFAPFSRPSGEFENRVQKGDFMDGEQDVAIVHDRARAVPGERSVRRRGTQTSRL
ncbi:hypothetical protein LXA43DRAFT_418825 [Ganoderma leucocontextum]|nr:hypothetical protein LXA43DRAFT_418825 [Ganoderma leucocontextum]